MDYAKSLEETRKQVSYFNSLISTKKHYLDNVNKTITLRNVQGPIPNKATVKPQEHHLTKELLGVEKLSPEQAKDRAFHPTRKTKISLYDGLSFDLNDETQRINWNWIQYTPLVVETLAEARMSPMAMFYVEDDEREIMERVTKADTCYNAEKVVRDWQPSERMNNARLLGQDMSNHTPDEVLIYLVDKARASPAEAQTILDLQDEPYRKERLLMLRLLDAGIIENKNGSFYYQSIRLGVDDRSALAYMLNSEHRDIVDQMKAVFENMRKPNLSGHVDVPVRGNVLPASSTGVNPPMLPPAPPQRPDQLTLGQLATLAPLGYRRLQSSLPPALFDYLREHPDQLMFEKIVKDEMDLLLAQFVPVAPAVPTAPIPPVPASVQPVISPVSDNAASITNAFALEDELEEYDNPARAAGIEQARLDEVAERQAQLQKENGIDSTELSSAEAADAASTLPPAANAGATSTPAKPQPTLSAAKQRRADAEAKKTQDPAQ